MCNSITNKEMHGVVQWNCNCEWRLRDKSAHFNCLKWPVAFAIQKPFEMKFRMDAEGGGWGGVAQGRT